MQLCKWIAGFMQKFRSRVVSDSCIPGFISVNAVAQGCDLSLKLFLPHINDMLPVENIQSDDSTVHGGNHYVWARRDLK